MDEETMLQPPVDKKRRTEHDDNDHAKWMIEAPKPPTGGRSKAAPVVALTVKTNNNIDDHEFAQLHNNSILQQVNIVTPSNDSTMTSAEEAELDRSHDSINGRTEDNDHDIQGVENGSMMTEEASNENTYKENRDAEGNDNNAVVVAVTEERALDWDAIRQHPETRQHVEQYWDAKRRRDEAQLRFNVTLDELQVSYMKCIDAVLEAAGLVHQEQRQDALDAMETELVQLFVGNDRMRTQMQRDLERSSRKFQSTFFNFMASLHGTGGDGGGNDGNASNADSPTKGAGEDDPNADQEPDWDAMMERHPKAADGIRRYLASREQLEVADSTFGIALDDINVALKANIGTLIDTAVRVYEKHAQTLDTMEDRLLDHFEYNHEQRSWMHQALEDSAQKAQELFATLMSNLHHKPSPESKQEQEMKQENVVAFTRTPATAETW